ncbi:hypothetical protein BH11PSE2_BH11PSE2_08700 [soil metagenome]
MDLGDPPDAIQRATFEAAFLADDFTKAFGAYQLALIRRAVSLLGKQSYAIEWAKDPQSTLEFAGGLAAAVEQLVEQEGDDASYKLIVVRDVIASVAWMQVLLARRGAHGQLASDTLAQLVLQGIRLGNVEVMLGQTEGGFMDEFAGLKWKEHLDFERRSKGANAANDRKSQMRIAVLRAAQDIVKVNPTLSNDELAFKLKAAAHTTCAIRTVSGWIRGWRKDERLPPLR